MAENMIKFLRGNVASLPQTATAGAVYFTKDEGLYLGLEDGSYHRYGDFITVDDVASLPAEGAHKQCMYYCVSENVLAKWDGSAWVQINKQKTLAELGGVAESVYKAKIAALEKADTDNATAISGVDTRLQAAEEKLKSVATTEGLGELTDRVGTAEGKITALETATAEGGAVSNAIADAKKAGTDAAAAAATAQAAAEAAQTTADSKATMAEVEAKNYATKTEAQGYADAKDEAIAEAKKAGDDAQDAVDALAGKVGTVPADKTVVQMIADAQAAATYDDTQVKADIKANADAIDAIEADYLKAADKTELANAINAEKERAEGIEGGLDARLKAVEDDYLKSADKEALQTQIDTIMSNPDAEGAINSINEFAQYVKDHGTIADGFRADINKNKEDIAAVTQAIADQATSDAATFETKTDAAAKLTEAKGYTDTKNEAMDTRVKVLEAINHDAYIAADETVLAGAKAYTDEKNTAMDTRVKVLEAIDHEAYKAYADKAEEDAVATANAYTDELANGQVKANTEAIATKAAQTDLDGVAGRVTTAEGKITALETASATHALKTDVEAVQTALDEYEEANDAAVALKANSADVYAKTETYTKTEVNSAVASALETAFTWGSF